MCALIGEFIQNNDLHNNTDLITDILMKFDNSKQNFVTALQVPSNQIEMEDFCKKMLYKIRYVFSRLGRLLNCRNQTNKWLVKDNNRLLKRIAKENPDFLHEMKVNKIKLVNIDSHENKNAKFELLTFLKKIVDNWKKEVEYQTLMRNETPFMCCRI